MGVPMLLYHRRKDDPSDSRQADGYAKPLPWKGGDAYGLHSVDTLCSVTDHCSYKKVTAPRSKV